MALLCVTSASAALSKGPYLMYEGADTTMSVLWQTSAAETNTLHWGTDTGYGLGQANVSGNAAFNHKYTITGLQPGTTYYYEVVGYGSGSFRTAPAATATAVKLLAYGDTRSTPAQQELVAGRMRAAYAGDPNYQTIVFHAGDWVASDAETNWTNEWFVKTSPQLHALQAEVPITGVRGNHEGSGTYYKKYFPEAYVAGFYRSFDYGPVHVTVIDQYSTYTAGSAQYNWIVNDLAASAKPWKIVLLHEPGWSANGGHANNATVQNLLEPLFEQYRVDMVIAGHNHYYARGVVNNIQHLTLGGGGAPLYAPASSQPNIVKTSQSYHHVEIAINGSTMNCTTRKSDGSLIETFSVVHNQSPIADAGSDQTVMTTGSGAAVTLNGSDSSDPDGSITSYVWKEGANPIATGVSPTISLGLGVHTITLTVTDNRGATASTTVSITVAVPTFRVSLALDGSGSGTIHSVSTPATSDLNCSGTCSSSYPVGTVVTLSATTAAGSTFSGWGQDCSGLGPCSVTLDADRNMTATFGLGPNNTGPMAMVGPTGLDSISSAYQACALSDTILVLAGNHAVGTITLNSGKVITLKGGYDATFQTNGQTSILQGYLGIRSGLVRAGHIALQP